MALGIILRVWKSLGIFCEFWRESLGNRLGVPCGKRIKKGEERFTVGLAIEYLTASMVEKCYDGSVSFFLSSIEKNSRALMRESELEA